MTEQHPVPAPRAGRPARPQPPAVAAPEPDGAAVLVVEDDDAVGIQLVRGLIRAGYAATRVSTGSAALAAVGGPAPPEVVLLDLGLPDIDGTEVCRRIRELGDTAIIVVTARSDEADRVETLDLGGDDYLVKPFGFAELLARIRAVRRRWARAAGQPKPTAATAPTADRWPTGAQGGARPAAGGSGHAGPAPTGRNGSVPAPGAGAASGGGAQAPVPVAPAVGGDPDLLRHGGLVVDRRTRRIELNGQRIAVTAREFDLLAFLAADPGRVRTRREIFRAVWGDWFGSTKVLDVHIGALRRKLRQPGLIETVYGVGFRLADAPDAGAAREAGGAGRAGGAAAAGGGADEAMARTSPAGPGGPSPTDRR